MIRKIVIFVSFSVLFTFLLKSETLERKAVLCDISQGREVVEKEASIFSVKQALEVAGINYSEETSLSECFKAKFTIIPFPINSGLFSGEDISLIKNYLSDGGILLFSFLDAPEMFEIAGVKEAIYGNTRVRITFDTSKDKDVFKFINRTLEKTISLGKEKYVYIFKTISYKPSSSISLGYYNTGEPAFIVNKFLNGYVYTLGVKFKDVIMRNLLNRDMEAERVYSNGFEPTTDVIYFLIRNIYLKHTKYGVWKKTVPSGYSGALMITHDVDSETSMDLMLDFGEMENSYNVTSTYNVTTSYYRYTRPGGLDWGGFYNKENIEKLKKLLKLNQKLGAHTVGHFTDFDYEDVFPMGYPGNKPENYKPYWDEEKGRTIGGTVYGECEIPKNLLENDTGVQITIYRTGHLLWNDFQANVVDTLGYLVDSSVSANDVLTNFPYPFVYNRAYDGKSAKVYEIPMTLSDVFPEDPITYENYEEKAQYWLENIIKNNENYAPTVLLVHPNRNEKIKAEEHLIKILPKNTLIIDMESFERFWRKREELKFKTIYIERTNQLFVVIDNKSFPLTGNISFIIKNEDKAPNYVLTNEELKPIPASILSENDESYEIGWNFRVEAKRYTEKSWTIEKDVAIVKVKVGDLKNGENSKIVIEKRKKGEEFKTIKEVSVEEIEGEEYEIFDEDIENDENYEYRALLMTKEGLLILSTNEVEI